jgi:type III secretory pathway lipoprotein EscJ
MSKWKNDWVSYWKDIRAQATIFLYLILFPKCKKNLYKNLKKKYLNQIFLLFHKLMKN